MYSYAVIVDSLKIGKHKTYKKNIIFVILLNLMIFRDFLLDQVCKYISGT